MADQGEHKRKLEEIVIKAQRNQRKLEQDRKDAIEDTVRSIGGQVEKAKADAEAEKAKAEASGEGGAAPKPQSFADLPVDVGDGSNPDAARPAAAGLHQALGPQTTQLPGSTEQISSDGRSIITKGIQETRAGSPGGALDVINSLFGSNFGVGQRQTQDSRINPQRQVVLERVASGLGTARSRVENGDMSPGDYTTFIAQQTKGLNPREAKEVTNAANRTFVNQQGIIRAKNKAVAQTIALDDLEKYPSLGGQLMEAAYLMVNETDPQKRKAATDAYSKLILGSKESKSAQDRQADADHINHVNSQLAELRLAEEQFIAKNGGELRAAAAKQIKFQGFLTEAGLIDDRKQDQINKSLDTWIGTDFSEEKRGLIEQDQRAALQKGMLVPLVDSKNWHPSGPTFTNMDFRLVQKYADALDGATFDKRGNITNDPEKANSIITRQIRSKGRTYLTEVGFAVENPTPGVEFQRLGIGLNPDNPNNGGALEPALELLSKRNVYQDETGTSVVNIYDFESEIPGQQRFEQRIPVTEPLSSDAARTLLGVAGTGGQEAKGPGTAGARAGRGIPAFIGEVARARGARATRQAQERIAVSRGQTELLGTAAKNIGDFFAESIGGFGDLLQGEN